VSAAVHTLEKPRSPASAALAGGMGVELSDDDLEAVVGGLARTLEWKFPVVGD
jgi:hypothetical protein